jgi:(R)-2-hydroxyacyl-CoA dehydratese activating ATPase
MPICAGIDAGSRAIKIVLLEAPSLRILAAGAADQGIAQEKLTLDLLERLLRQCGLERRQIDGVVATGYGRKLIQIADSAITEITCQAWGVRHQVPGVRTIVDIGGQDSKLLRVDADGAVEDFAMNDRCAAGSGRFLEVLANQLGVHIETLGQMADKSRRPALISSMCVVFAETEIVGLLASGTAPEDIVAGVQASIAARVAAMGGRQVSAPVVFTGGVAMVPGMSAALASALRNLVEIAPHPQMTGALGAAILAARRLEGLKTAAL